MYCNIVVEAQVLCASVSSRTATFEYEPQTLYRAGSRFPTEQSQVSPGGELVELNRGSQSDGKTDMARALLSTELKLNLPLFVINHQSIKSFKDVDVQIHAFLTSEVGGDGWSASLPGWVVRLEFPAGNRTPNS